MCVINFMIYQKMFRKNPSQSSNIATEFFHMSSLPLSSCMHKHHILILEIFNNILHSYDTEV